MLYVENLNQNPNLNLLINEIRVLFEIYVIIIWLTFNKCFKFTLIKSN